MRNSCYCSDRGNCTHAGCNKCNDDGQCSGWLCTGKGIPPRWLLSRGICLADWHNDQKIRLRWHTSEGELRLPQGKGVFCLLAYFCLSGCVRDFQLRLAGGTPKQIQTCGRFAGCQPSVGFMRKVVPTRLLVSLRLRLAIWQTELEFQLLWHISKGSLHPTETRGIQSLLADPCLSGCVRDFPLRLVEGISK